MRWRVQLLGGLRAEHEERILSRFRTQKTGALLAYLAYHLTRAHSREVLIEILWPECEPEAGRNSLSVALSSLRHQLEPPGVPAGAVIRADRASVQLNPSAVTTDVVEFEAALAAASRARSGIEQEQHLTQALELYQGPLLAGYYEDWIPAEQERLAERYLQALRQLFARAEQTGDLARALDYARRAAAADPLREETHQDLMRLYAALGQPSAALRQFHELERILHEELGQTPSPATRTLIDQLAVGSGQWAGDRAATDVPAARRPTPSGPQLPTADCQLPSGAPAGTVTFLLTDIERSTALWEQAGEAYKTALASHHALLRREFRRFGGYEAKEAGDSFLVAFERAGDALACAVAAQRALSALSWPAEVGPLRVRMALHTGDVEIEDGEYRGLVLHHASRMVVAAHGGQILCSEVTAGVLRRGGIAALEPGVRLRDLGVYRLRDVEILERLFQVEDAQVTQVEFPPLRAEAGHAGHLPVQFTRFFGRQAELAQVRERVLSKDARLVTLTGPGGSGKTRLALEAAGQFVDAFHGAVWFVPLADLSDARLMPDAVRDALRLPRSPHLTAIEQVLDALSRHPTLLLLDNFEHLVDQGTPFVRTLLERLPALKCLVTSRQRLDLEGERELAVLPLPTPDPGVQAFRRSGVQGKATPSDLNARTPERLNALSPEQLSLYESVQLFVDRAQAVRPDFQVTNANAPAVAELCHRLEGIPLAIELAAARAQVLTPAQMLAQLEHRFDFLISRRRDAIARHRTLRAAIEWGYQLLAPELQRFFAHLSVFRGGWTLEAAEAVCLGVEVLRCWGVGETGVPQGAADTNDSTTSPAPNTSTPQRPNTSTPDVLDYLAQLRECSLVLADEAAVGMRFRMLETLREFAAEQLSSSDERDLARRHALYYLALAEEPGADGGSVLASLPRLLPELDNFRTALRWALKTEPEIALRLAVALKPFWTESGFLSEGRDALNQALARVIDAPVSLRTRALQRAAGMASGQGDYPAARSLLEETLRLSRERGDRRSIADALTLLGHIASMQAERERALLLLEESIALWREVDDRRGLAIALSCMAPFGSRAHVEESLQIYRELGDRRGIAMQLNNLGVGCADHDQARALLQESLAILRELGDRMGSRSPLIHLGLGACRQGDYVEARALLTESLALSRDLGDKRLIVECLEGLAEVAGGEGRPERAVMLYAAADALRETTGFRYWQPRRDAGLATVRAAIARDTFLAAWDAGRTLTWQEASDYALQDAE